MSRKKHPVHHEEEHADETWLVPYSDILTLLLALFIVLFASAQIDQKKVEQLSKSFVNSFHGDTSVLESMKSIPQTDVPPTPPKTTESTLVIGKISGVSDEEQAYTAETMQLLEVKKILDKYILDNDLVAELETSFTDEGLMIRIRESALFSSGSAEVMPQSRKLALTIAKMIAPLTQKVVISGHTDNMPIATGEFPTNWDLSAKRAVNFLKVLLSQGSINKPERFSAVGYGEFHPLVANTSEEERAKNRRVEVLIVRNVRY